MPKKPSPPPVPDAEACAAMARTCLSASLRRTERLVTRVYDEHLRAAGVTAVQLPMLASIAAQEAPTLRLLTEQLELERSTLSRNLALLRRRGLIKLGPSSGPKPGLITLTAKGRATLARAHEQWQKAHQELMEALEAKALARGLEFLRKVRQTARRM